MAYHHEWLGTGIMAKELVPIIFTCVTRRPMLCHRHIDFQYDNEGFVAAISKGSSKRHNSDAPPTFSMILIAHFDITITAAHLPGVINTVSLVES